MTTKTSRPFSEEISTVAAAEKYQLTPSYVARLARTHIIGARKFVRDWIIDEETLRNYLAQPRKPGPKPHRQKTQATVNGVHTSSQSEGKQHATAKGQAGKRTVS